MAGLKFLTKDIEAVPERRSRRVDPAEKEKLKGLKLQQTDNFLTKNSGFVPPSKLQKKKSSSIKQDNSDSSSTCFSETGSQRTSATRSSSVSSRHSRRSSSGKSNCNDCRHHAHDERGNCIIKPGAVVQDHSRRKKRLLGVKPPRCNTAADGLFLPKKGSKTRGLQRSKTIG